MRFLVIGDGRLARHIRFYFQSLGLTFDSWNRRRHSDIELPEKLQQASAVLLAISDSAIEEFAGRILSATVSPALIHFSGAHEFAGMTGAHPLMTFTSELYSPETYSKIPLISVAPKPANFGLPNPWVQISAKQKPFYHALCVLGGNFSALLWQNYFFEMKRLGLTREDCLPYFDRCFQNLRAHPEGALTGPLARGDRETIQNNLQSLAGDPFRRIYESFYAEFPRIQEKLKTVELL